MHPSNRSDTCKRMGKCRRRLARQEVPIDVFGREHIVPLPLFPVTDPVLTVPITRSFPG